MNLRLLTALIMGAIITGACVAGEDKTFKDAITGLSRKDFINKIMKYGILHEQFKRECMPLSDVRDTLKDTRCASLVDQIYDTYGDLYPERRNIAMIEEPFTEKGAAMGDAWNGAWIAQAARQYYWRK